MSLNEEIIFLLTCTANRLEQHFQMENVFEGNLLQKRLDTSVKSKLPQITQYVYLGGLAIFQRKLYYRKSRD